MNERKEWMCSRCGRKYTFKEYSNLPLVWIDPNDPELGKVAVCKCGARFHLDKWKLQDRVELETKWGKFECLVSTVSLELCHHWGGEWGYWYETMIFADWLESEPQWRYKTKADAEEWHRRIVDLLKRGKFKLKPVKFDLTFWGGEEG